MKLKIIEDISLDDDEVTLICKRITPEIKDLITLFQSDTLLGYRRGQEVMIPLHDIIFFETENELVYVHTKGEHFETKYRLYELENLLPTSFCRISKSGIVNTQQITAMEKSLTSNRVLTFKDSHKIIYVSRKYYPILKEKLTERSFIK